MVVYKDKSCIDCNIKFIPTSGVQVRCGNYKEKYGCAYKRRLLRDRNMKTSRRKGEYSPFFMKECDRCKEVFSCNNVIKKFCGSCYPEARKESARLWYKENRDRVNLCIRNTYKKRKSESNYRLKDKIMRKLRNSLINNSELTSIELSYLGCSVTEWRKYLESKFEEHMNWDNYGSVWDIDHIVPFKVFNMDIEEDRYKVFNYTNTQPLDSYINRHVKRDRLDYIK